MCERTAKREPWLCLPNTRHRCWNKWKYWIGQKIRSSKVNHAFWQISIGKASRWKKSPAGFLTARDLYPSVAPGQSLQTAKSPKKKQNNIIVVALDSAICNWWQPADPSKLQGDVSTMKNGRKRWRRGPSGRVWKEGAELQLLQFIHQKAAEPVG